MLYYRSLIVAAVIVTWISSTNSLIICSKYEATTFNLTCPSGYSINHIRGYYDKDVMDRYYCFTCRYNRRRAMDCYNTGHRNKIGGPLSVKCRQNYFLAGVHSYYNRGNNDQSFAFRCCHNWGQCTVNCHSEGPINNSGSFLSYRVKNNEFIIGARSSHNKSNKK